MVIHERTNADLAAAKARGKKSRRPARMKSKDMAAAKALLTNPDLTVEDIAKRLHVSPATLYRHVPGGRNSIQDGI